jgi:hypothetical protein
MIKKLLDILFKRHINTGVLDDDRTDKQKEYAYDIREIAGSSPVKWEEKTTWKSYPVRRQHFTFECVAHSVAKHLGINHQIETGSYMNLCNSFFYWHRMNRQYPYNNGGMHATDSMNLSVKKGTCHFGRLPQRLRERDPETAPNEIMMKEAFEYAGKDFFEDKERTMDSIARMIDQFGSCIVWFYFDTDGREWWRPEPVTMFSFANPYVAGTTRHSVVATDYGLRNGKKVIKIEDSAGNEYALNNQDRFIDEKFLSRCFLSWVAIDKPNNQTTMQKPKWNGKRNLRIGMTGDDVMGLQQILKYHGCFDYPTFTRFFGGYTRAGVIKLQEKFASEILTPLGLKKGTGNVFGSTRQFLDKNHK